MTTMLLDGTGAPAFKTMTMTMTISPLSTSSIVKVYVGGLRSDANKYDIEDAFSEYGKVSRDAIINLEMEIKC